MRQFTRHLIVLPSASLPPGCAGVSSDDAIVVGDSALKHFVLAHEISHSLDARNRPTTTPTPNSNSNLPIGISISPTWRASYALDSATVSEYARSAWPEQLAETGVAALYDAVVPGGLASAGNPSYGGVMNQVGAWRREFGRFVDGEGGCGLRRPDSPMVGWDD